MKHTFSCQDPIHRDTLTFAREPTRDNGFSVTIESAGGETSWGVFIAPGDAALLHAWLGSALADYLNE